MKVGLIGCGGMGTTHNLSLKALSSKMDVEVTALADCRPEFLEKAAEQWPDARLYKTGMELLEADVGQRAYLPSQLSPHRTCGGSHGQRDQCVRGEAGMSDGGGGTEASGCQGEEPRTGYGWSGGPFL